MKYSILGDNLTVKAGGTLSSIVTITSTKSTQCKGIAVQFLGIEKTYGWPFWNTHVLLDKCCEVYNNNKKIGPEDSIRVNSGGNTFPFDFRIPDDLPPSGSGSYWSITYKLQIWTLGSLLRSRRNIRYECTLTVEPHLNLDTGFFAKVSQTEISLTDSVHWGSEVVSATLQLHSSGWLTGESISGRIRCFNDSRWPQIVECSLEQIEKVKSTEKIIKHHEKKIATQSFGSFFAKDSGWETFQLTVPTDCKPSGLFGSRKVHISYVIQLTLNAGEDQFPMLVIRAPVYIGTNRSETPLPHPSKSCDQQASTGPSSGIGSMASSDRVGLGAIVNPSFETGDSQTRATNIDSASVSSFATASERTASSDSLDQTRVKECASAGASPSSSNATSRRRRIYSSASCEIPMVPLRRGTIEDTERSPLLLNESQSERYESQNRRGSTQRRKPWAKHW